MAFVSESVKLLLSKIVSGEFVDFFRSTKLDYLLLEKLNITLLSLQSILNDAEQKQITDPAVKEWLVKLQDVVFDAEDLFDEINTEVLQDVVFDDAEDLLDEINTELLRYRVKAEHEGRCFKVLKFLSSLFKSSYETCTKNESSSGTNNSKIQTLHKKLEHFANIGEHFANKGSLLGLRDGVPSIGWHGTPISSVVVDESTIYGRDNDRKRLKDFLLSEDAGEGGSKIGVVSIVGMGGIGKTTLAKLLYNDPEVNRKFNLKAWAHISKDVDVVNVTKALLESVGSKSTGANNPDTLQVQFQQSLRGKMFLLVLDDIWGVRDVVWNSLKDVFNVGEIGSRIVITTRNERDALAMKNFLSIHKLEPLESEDCWSLLAKHAFGASNYEQRSNLKEIGREIAKKCDGLPLAAVALGDLLRIKLSPNDWNNVLKSNIWELENTRVQPALLLSYHYLPAPLKRCFAYCAIFPKNSILEKKVVVQLWIAEGLVLHQGSEKSWENVGEEYFDELVSRSFIHRRFVDGNEIFEMHDLINDLATMVSCPYCISIEEQKEVENLDRVRHLSYTPNAYSSYAEFNRMRGWKGMHTLLYLPLPESQLSDYCMYYKALNYWFRAMKHLHSLSLLQCKNITNQIPTSIGNLIYLRYLNLSGTPIVRLPSETCKLLNLQTLIVSDCRSLIELPEDVGKLVSLRNLDVSNTPLREMPVQIAKLKNLQTLSDFIVSKECDGLKVGELGKFPQLRRKLSISELQNVTDPSDASQANLDTKKQIDELILKWHHPAPSDSNLQTQSVVLERLQPTVNLKSLTIDGYGGTNFPNWLGNSSYGNMVYLEIKNCDNCSRLPPLGQLGNLKELSICGMKSVKSVGVEFYGNDSGPSFQPFQSLETLSFYDMQGWEEWNLIGGMATEFPTLRRLTLDRCLKLKGHIPTNLPSFLRDITIKDCDELESFSLGGLGF